MAKAKPKAERQHQMTQEELAEFSACSPVQGAAGFIRFCQKHVKIECKLTKTIIPFVLYDCQRDHLAGVCLRRMEDDLRQILLCRYRESEQDLRARFHREEV